MKSSFRQSMGWLHTWAGLLVGWILFFIFLTGTAGYFDTEIDLWMQPERPILEHPMPAARSVDTARRQIEEFAPDAERWFFSLPTYRYPELRLFWKEPDGADGKRGKSGIRRLNATDGSPLEFRATGGGQLLYRMHWRLHYMPVGVAEWIVGICTMFMLVGIVTGVVIHRRIFRDFFTLRLGKGQRSWLDAHNVLSVLALPFHFMITYSGLVFIGYVYMAPVIAATYGAGDEGRDTFYKEAMRRTDPDAAAGVAARLAPLTPMIAEAERRWGPDTVRYVDVRFPGDSNATVTLAHEWASPLRRSETLTFDGTSGTLLKTNDGTYSGALTTRDVVLGLHEGLFAGTVLRWIYFLSGLAGTAMIGAGLVLWCAKRRDRAGDTFGYKLVSGLNVGTVVGLPIAVAAYFWANRLIPADMAGRAPWEANAMFIVWGLMLAHGLLRSPSRAWLEQLALAACAYCLLPLVNALTTDRHLGVTLPAGLWDLAGFDLTVLAFGLLFMLLTWKSTRNRRREQAAHPAAAQSEQRAEAA